MRMNVPHSIAIRGGVQPEGVVSVAVVPSVPKRGRCETLLNFPHGLHLADMGRSSAAPYPAAWLDLLEVGVTFYEFFCAAAGETYAQATVFVVALYSDYCAYAVFCVADLLSQQGIGVGTAFEGRAREIAGWRRAPSRRS
jgi:hypothetical protein